MNADQKDRSVIIMAIIPYSTTIQSSVVKKYFVKKIRSVRRLLSANHAKKIFISVIICNQFSHRYFHL